MIANITDRTFGRLIVICESQKRSNSGEKFFWTQCVCGNFHIVNGRNLKSGNIKSCGCLLKEARRKNAKLVHQTNIKHGMRKNRIYTTWRDMRQRCKNPKRENYKNYGGRGISICQEWEDFIVFKNWAYSHGYQDDLTIDRIDNDGNYEPSNCRWLTQRENTRTGSKGLGR